MGSGDGSSSMNKLIGETKCSICFDLMFAAVETNCKHRFCQSCLKTWLNGQFCVIQKICPLCRGGITVITQLPSLSSLIRRKFVQELDEESQQEWLARAIDIQQKSHPDYLRGLD